MQWTESIIVDRPAPQVFAAIADEHELMRWSAWPEATGFSCAVDGDGTSIGSQIVFTSPAGEEQGRQTLTRVEPGRLVEYRLANRGPRGRTMRPEVDFRLEPAGDSGTSTVVHLDFRNEVPLPPGVRHVADALIGRRIRALHAEDLRLLKRHVEAA